MSQIAPKDVQSRVAAYINEHGIIDAAKFFGLSRETIAKVAAGVNVNAGTVALVKEKLRGV